jgi:multisubunit Na+/H+ antiporter MnhF subunit
VNGFVVAGRALRIGVITGGGVLVRGTAMEAVVAFEAISSIIVMVLVLLAEGFARSAELEFPELLAVLMLGSGLVFVRFLERGL